MTAPTTLATRTRADGWGLVLLVAVEVVSVVALHGLADQPWARLPEPSSTLGGVTPTAALLALARLLALAAAWWLLGTTLAYLVARACNAGMLASGLGMMALPGARRVVDRALATSLLLSSLSSPVLAAAPPHVPPEPPPPEETTEPARPSEPDRAEREAGHDERTGELRTHTVARGEHLWQVARDTLAAARTGGPDTLTTQEIATYWLRLVEANRDRVASGDPDLVHPGEVLHLPPLDDA